MRLAIVSILALFVGNSSFGQGCCSGGGGSPLAGGASAGVLQERQVQLVGSYKYTRSDRFMSGDRDTTAFFDNLSSDYLFLKADYGLTKKLTFSVAAGYYLNRTITEHADTTMIDGVQYINSESVTSSGFGDLILFPRYNVYSNEKNSIQSELTLGLGFKMPLGRHDDSTFVGQSYFLNQDDPSSPFIDSIEIWQTSPPTVQATTGSNDLMFYAFYLKNFKKKNFKLFTSALYIHKGWNSLGIKFGDYATVGLYGGTSVLNNRLSLLGQLKGEWVGRMQAHENLNILSLYNIEQESTGSAMLSFVPQATYMFKKPQISVFATADIPMYQFMRGTQISSGIQITGGISYRFFAKELKKTLVQKEERLFVYQEERFKVFGICGMCKETIEGTLNSMAGVSFANWDQKSQSLKVRFDSLKLSLDDLKVALAEVGYDSDTHKATDVAYENLHSCCKYERL